MKNLLVVVACWLMMVGSAHAEAKSLSLNFNDDSAQARFNMIIKEDVNGTSLLDFRGLYNDEDDLSSWLTSAGVNFVGTLDNAPGLELGVIADLKAGDSDRSDTEFGAVGVGGLVNYFPPELGGFGVGSRFVYSPKIFTFLEAENISEFSARVSYNIAPNIGVHIEYQKVRVDFDTFGKRDIDEELRIGFEARF